MENSPPFCYNSLKGGQKMFSVWDNVLAEIEQKIPSASFATWFSDTSLLSSDDGNIVIGVKNSFFVKNLRGKFGDIITTALKNNHVEVNTLSFEVVAPKKSRVRPHEVLPETESKSRISSPQKLNSRSSSLALNSFKSSLNPNYTLESFVVTSNNDLAASVAKNIVESPGKNYNPFYLYGGPGLGKTHLVQAIGNELVARYPGYKVLYSPINDFYSDFIDSVRKGKGKEFSEKFKKLDCLIIDDIQFIVGKEKSQDEFFNIFNTLHQLGKQIIITSDRLPSQIKSIDERLSSRLSWAGTYDIQLPKFEDKCAILRAKTDFMGVEIEEEAIEYLAENVTTNIRDLEGALNTLLTLSDLRGLTPLEIIKQGGVNISRAPSRGTITPRQAVTKVAKYYNLTYDTLCGKSRVSNIKNARQVAMYILKNDLNLSTSKIAPEVGVSDHTTVMHGIKKVTDDLRINFKLREDIEEIRSKLYD